MHYKLYIDQFLRISFMHNVNIISNNLTRLVSVSRQLCPV